MKAIFHSKQNRQEKFNTINARSAKRYFEQVFCRQLYSQQQLVRFYYIRILFLNIFSAFLFVRFP